MSKYKPVSSRMPSDIPSTIRTSADLTVWLHRNKQFDITTFLELIDRLTDTPDWVVLEVTADHFTIGYLPTHDSHTFRLVNLAPVV